MGNTTHPLYDVWRGMRKRCNNPKEPGYRYYGGRGIKVCPRWDSFADFSADMGPRPSDKHTIERKDNDGDYEPGNCRWATAKEQANNRRPMSAEDTQAATQRLLDYQQMRRLRFDEIIREIAREKIEEIEGEFLDIAEFAENNL